ncbi:MAG: ABC transporter permease, partial [Oscillospiraceae bacterium]|nr:ABC transporter permease [Oscillospiraceae bacterium]
SPYELKKQLNDECDIIDMCISSASKDELIDNTRIFSDVGSRMVLVYMIQLVSIIMIIMNNSISSSIEMDYTDLGILRSQGFTQTQIRMSFVLQYTLALVIGAVIGLVFSIPGCGALIRLFMNMTGMLTKTDISLGKCLLLSIGIILLCVIFIFLATAKIGKISPVRAISGGRDEVYFDGSINMPVRQKGLPLLLALRQITSDIKNYIGIAVMMAILIFFLVTTTSFVGGFDPDNIFSGMTGDIKINSLGDLSLSDGQKIEEALGETDSGAYLSMETSHRMDVEGQQIDVRSYIRDEDQFSPIQGRAPQYDNEIMITKSVSRSTGKAIGDTLHIKYTDHSGDYIITGYFQTVHEFGVLCATTTEGMKKLGYEKISDAYVTLSDHDKLEIVTDMLNDRFGDILKAEKTEESESMTKYKGLIDSLLDIIAYVIYGISVVFAAVVVVMMTKAAFLRERTDLGIYKAVGFTSSDLRMQFAIRFLAVAIIGTIAGLILSLAFTRTAIGFMLRTVGLTDFSAPIKPDIFLIPSVVVCACVFVFAYISSRRIKTVEVRELITE